MKRLLAAAILLICSTVSSAAPFHGNEVSDREYGQRGVPLWDHQGQARSLGDYRGKIVLLFTGFLHCSSYCPLTLVKYRQVIDLLGPDSPFVQVVYVTLDPERDTPDLLKNYLGAFHPSFIGLYTRPDKTRELAKALGAHFQKVPGSKPGDYMIDHSVETLVFDIQGKPRLMLPDELSAQQIVEDVRRLLEK